MLLIDSGSLLRLARQFHSGAEKIEFIRASHNTTYRVLGEHAPFILRVTAMEHRTLAQLESELDFQTYLHQNQAPVVRPLKTQDDQYIITYIYEGKTFYIAAFSLAEGENWDQRCENAAI